MTRDDKIFSAVRRDGLGLEIGPSYNPLAPKKAGFNVETVDHLDRAGLIEKYGPHGVDVTGIEEVDYVWKGQPLSELIGATARYDWIIASHVIEHVPDVVGFLNECEKLLKPDGTLSLAIPDKRYCFDYFRSPSSTGDVIQASLEKRQRHPPGWVFDHFSSVSKLGDAITWSQGSKGSLQLVHPFTEAKQLYDWSLSPDAPYIDIHAWRFTPSSFRLIMHDLGQLGLTGLSESRFYDTTGCEFYVSLRPGRSAVESDRLQLAKGIQHELAQAVLK
jgi:SAM-dependent methyltransferase